MAFWVVGWAWVFSLESTSWAEQWAAVIFAILVCWRLWLPLASADRVAFMVEKEVEAPAPGEVQSVPHALEMPDGIYIRKFGQFRLAISEQVQHSLVMGAQAGHVPQGAVAQTVLTAISEATQLMNQQLAGQAPPEDKPA